ncbi:MAG: hypothetical protein Q9171_006953 [Xanthocarpia ochracea]
MPLQDLTDIVDRVWYWINRSDEKVPAKIAAAYNQKGGWEGWAQVEIAYLVEEKYSNVTIDREVNVYEGTAKENDFVITDNHDATKPKQIIELKTERGTQTPTEFKKSFLADIKKIQTSPIDPKYKPAQAFAVAISRTIESHKLLFETEWERGTKVTRVECKDNIYIWWYEQDIV